MLCSGMANYWFNIKTDQVKLRVFNFISVKAAPVCLLFFYRQNIS